MQSMLQGAKAKETVAQQIQEARSRYNAVPVYPAVDPVSVATINANVRDAAAITGAEIPEYAKELAPSGDPETITEIPLDMPKQTSGSNTNNHFMHESGVTIMAKAVHDMFMFPWTKPAASNDLYVPVENLEQAKELCESLIAGDESI